MRVLFLAEGDAETWDSWSGCSKSLVDHLRAQGHTITCGDVDLRGWRRLTVGLRNFAFDRRRWWAKYHLGALGFAARSRRAAALVRAHRDVDLIVQAGATFQITEAAGIPYVLYCDSNIEFARAGAASGFSDASRLGDRELAEVRARELQVYERAARIFTFSERLRTSFVRDFGIPADKVQAAFVGANFPVDQPPDVPARREERGPVVLFIGRAFHRKGGDLLLRAFRSVRTRIPAARLLIVGPDQLPPELEQKQDGIEFVGFVSKETAEGRATLMRAYAEARVFCLPTRFEAFGVVFLEAMYYGLPCIGPDAWAVPEIIDPGVTGLLVPPEDATALANAIVELLAAPERAAAMGEAGRRRFEELFTWHRVAERLATASTPLLARRADGAPAA